MLLVLFSISSFANISQINGQEEEKQHNFGLSEVIFVEMEELDDTPVKIIIRLDESFPIFNISSKEIDKSIISRLEKHCRESKEVSFVEENNKYYKRIYGKKK